MRKIYIIALVLTLLPGCSKTDFLETGSNGDNGCAITFNGQSAPITKTVTGADAAALLGGSFVVYGSKSNGTTYSTVFDGYNVKWVGSEYGVTPGKTWDYIGQQDLGSAEQSVKYWDNNATHYTFLAYSKGGGNAIFGNFNLDNVGTANPIYTVTGQPNNDQLYPVYIAEPVQVNKANYGKEPVSISFRPFRTKVRFGIYETIPGYSVENVTFYHTANIEYTGGAYPVVFPDGQFMPNMGEFEYSVYSSGDDGRLSVQYALKEGVMYKSNIAFDALAYSSDGMLGTTSANPSYFLDSLGNSYINVLPIGDHSGKLGIRVDFTLVPLDGSDSHKITVRDVMAYVPEEFVRWQPGYAYTYLFKISDAVDGLYPITFDAKEYLASDPLDAETIEGEIPITTYQKGSAMEESGAYNTTDNIYVTVGNFLQLNGTWPENAGFIRLYYATGTQKITEQAVENCLKNGAYDNAANSLSVTDAAGHTLTLTNAAQNMSIINELPESDAPAGNQQSHNKAYACISGQEAGTYVFVYDPSSYSNSRFCTLSKGQYYYKYEVEEYEDGNAYNLYYFQADGTEQYDPDTAVVSDLGLEYYTLVSDPDYYDSWYIQKSNVLPAGLPFFVPIKIDDRTYYGQYISTGTEDLTKGAVKEQGAYRLKHAVYFKNYEPGYTIESGEPYYEVKLVTNPYDGHIYTGYAKGIDYPVHITRYNQNQYVYAIKNQEKITKYPSGDTKYPFEQVTYNNNTKLIEDQWYFAIDGLDSFKNDDGTYNDGRHIYIEEYQASGKEYSLMAYPGWEGEYGLWYVCDGVGSYYPTKLYSDDYNTLVAGGHYCYFENDKTKRTYIANGTETPYYGLPTDNGLFIDNPDARPCIKIIEVR